MIIVVVLGNFIDIYFSIFWYFVLIEPNPGFLEIHMGVAGDS